MQEFLTKILWPIWGPLEFIQNHFKAVLLALILFAIFYSSEGENIKQPNLAKIYLSGPIISADEFLHEIKKAEDKKVKGALIVVNSPGGAVGPSVEMSLAVKRLKAKMPVVVYSEDAIASGSYYASIWADKIIANPGSIVGSIGVIFEGVNIEPLMKKIGVETQVVKAGEYKEMGTFARKWSKQERDGLESVINDTYAMFVEDVAKARKLDVNRSKEYANAQVFTAREAQKRGLIDSTGSINDAENELAKMAKVGEPVWLEKGKMESFLKQIASETATRLVQSVTGLKAY
jgi:protease IV